VANRPPALHELGDLQLKILSLLWKLGEASVNDLLAKWDGELPAYVTLLTVCRRLEKRGLMEHREQTRPGTKSCFIYKPRVTRQGVQRGMLEGLAARAFGSYDELTRCANQLALEADRRAGGQIADLPGSANVSCMAAGCHSCGKG
jgi:predicted transcriptional regulator